jgi:hypothetical protein
MTYPCQRYADDQVTFAPLWSRKYKLPGRVSHLIRGAKMDP